MSTTATIPLNTSSATSGGDVSYRNDDDSDTKAMVVVGCASGLVAWFTLLRTTSTACSSDIKLGLVSSKAQVWRSFDNAQVVRLC